MNEIQITTSFLKKKEDFKKSKKKFFIAGVIFTSVLLFLFYQVRAIILTPVIAQPYSSEASKISNIFKSSHTTEITSKEDKQPSWFKLISDATTAYFFDPMKSSESQLWVINKCEDYYEITSYSPKNQSWVINSTFSCDAEIFTGYEFCDATLHTFWQNSGQELTTVYPRNISNNRTIEVKITESKAENLQKIGENPNTLATKVTKNPTSKSQFRAEQDLHTKKNRDWKK